MTSDMQSVLHMTLLLSMASAADRGPGKPLDVEVAVVGPRSMRVTWRSPVSGPSVSLIDKFMIQYQALDDERQPVGVPLSGSQGPRDTSHFMEGQLQSETEYRITVVAHTKREGGMPSDPIYAKTKGNAPSMPRDFQVRLLNSSLESQPQAVLTWSAPQITQGTLHKYRLQIKNLELLESEPDNELAASLNRHVTQPLRQGTNYRFWLQAYNGIDYGAPAEEQFKTPDGEPRGAPINLSMTELGLGMVRLNWRPPHISQRNGRIVNYEVLYYPNSNESAHVRENTSDTFLSVTQLQADEAYSFQIKAYTSRGPGPWSTRVTYDANRPPISK